MSRIPKVQSSQALWFSLQIISQSFGCKWHDLKVCYSKIKKNRHWNTSQN